MLLKASAESEARILAIIGFAVALCCVAVAGQLIVFNPFGGRAAGRISVVIDTPYVGQGVAQGTAVVMHGVKVGEVTAISSLPAGGVRLDADLEKTPVSGLTDAMDIDFRPINYFGVTGINLAAGVGGQTLRDGMQIDTRPKGNFTLQALLSRLGEVSTGVLTPQLIQVIDRATRYTDALDPLIETALVAANAIGDVQTVSSAQLLANTTGLSVAFPSAVDALTDAGSALLHSDDNYMNYGIMDETPEEFENIMIPVLDESSVGLFNAVGQLESKHVSDLLPLINMTKSLADVVPPLIRPEGVAEMLIDLRTRFEKMYAGTPEQRALQVQIVLDALPGVAAPLGVMAGP